MENKMRMRNCTYCGDIVRTENKFSVVCDKCRRNTTPRKVMKKGELMEDEKLK